ncbi:MAG TPA: DUF397 domain-containing protein [Streptosporangiaceae bacterium]|jgi:hypothetical protein|nr:DUF397 domain-containing protein [Streptosporangiaceae bacterium]
MGEDGIAGTCRKSSYSGGDNNCVEVWTAGAGVAVRDTKDRPGGALRFSASAWQAFTEGINRR